MISHRLCFSNISRHMELTHICWASDLDNGWQISCKGWRDCEIYKKKSPSDFSGLSSGILNTPPRKETYHLPLHSSRFPTRNPVLDTQSRLRDNIYLCSNLLPLLPKWLPSLTPISTWPAHIKGKLSYSSPCVSNQSTDTPRPRRDGWA